MPAKIVIIDNDSSDNTVDIARQYAAKHQNIMLLSSGGNIGLAAGNNLVMPHISGDYLMILNPDTRLETDTIEKMLVALERTPATGIVGPQNLYEDGRRHRSFHGSWTLLHLLVWRLLPYSIVRRAYDSLSRYRERPVKFVSGSCLLIRSQLFKDIGGYDPAYFLTVEDACDLAVRAKAHGYNALFTNSTAMTHLCGRSNQQVPYLSTLEGYKGDIYYFHKIHGSAVGNVAHAIVVVACAFKIAISAAKTLIRRREIDKSNLLVYRRIFPVILGYRPDVPRSPGIASSH